MWTWKDDGIVSKLYGVNEIRQEFYIPVTMQERLQIGLQQQACMAT